MLKWLVYKDKFFGRWPEWFPEDFRRIEIRRYKIGRAYGTGIGIKEMPKMSAVGTADFVARGFNPGEMEGLEHWVLILVKMGIDG